MSRLVLTVTLVILSCASLPAQEASAPAHEAVKTISELRKIEVPKLDGLRAGPPPQVPGLLRQLNLQLRALIVNTLNNKSLQAVPSEEEIYAALRTAGWNEVPDNKWNAYGEITQIKFDWKLGYDPGILVVSTQLWIPCGSSDPDSAVYVFQGRSRQWKLVLATDADFDAVGNSTESGMQYEMSPPDSDGGWFLAIAHAPPSCRGAPPRIRYKVLRPGRTADEPLVLLSLSEPINSKFQPPFRLRSETNWAALTRGKERHLDGAAGVSIARYEIESKKVRRIQPLALSPDDFLDEWSQLDWAEASQWSSPSKQREIQHWHSLLNKVAFDSTELESINLCQSKEGSDSRWLIELSIDRQQNPSIADESLYIVVSERNGAYFVDEVQETRLSGCSEKIPDTLSKEWNLPMW
jgi:hypothetical protein